MADPTDDWRQLDPGLEEVLREIAARQEARLLRATRSTSKVRAALFSTDTRVSSRTAGMSSAERKLLDTYREEASYLLRKLALERMMEVEEYRNLTSLELGRGRRVELDGSARIGASIEISASRLERGYAGDSLTDLLSTLLRDDKDRPIDPGQLARWSTVIRPSDVAHFFAAKYLVLSGSYASAVIALDSMLARIQDPVLRARILSWKGVAFLRTRDFRRANQAYGRLSVLPDAAPGDVISAFTSAVQTGDLRLAHGASVVLEDRLRGEEDAIRRWIACCKRDRAAGGWMPTLASSRVLQTMGDSLGERARDVASVFL